jgi:Fuc2NAc and GlcNAc transferase
LQLIAVSAACLGFLPFNVPRARVFMGDVGSVLLGFVFASYALFLAQSPMEFLALAGCLFPFYSDTLITLFVRWRSGEKLSQAHRRHLYQILANQRQIPHWKISTGYSLIQAFIGISAIQLVNSPWLLCTFLGVSFLLWSFCTQLARKQWES